MKYDESRVILACNLLEFRAEKRISQEEMAFQIDLSVKSYAEIERAEVHTCLLYTSPSPRDRQKSRMPSSA